MHLQPIHIKTLEVAASRPGLLTRWECEFVESLNNDRNKFRNRDMFLSPGRATVLEKIRLKLVNRNIVELAA